MAHKRFVRRSHIANRKCASPNGSFPYMKKIYLVANGDLRLSANQMCEPAQAAMEKALTAAVEREGFTVQRAHSFDEAKQHGFIDSQKMGLSVFSKVPKNA